MSGQRQTLGKGTVVKSKEQTGHGLELIKSPKKFIPIIIVCNSCIKVLTFSLAE